MLIYACLANLYSFVYIRDPECVRPLRLMYTRLTRLKRIVFRCSDASLSVLANTLQGTLGK